MSGIYGEKYRTQLSLVLIFALCAFAGVLYSFTRTKFYKGEIAQVTGLPYIGHGLRNFKCYGTLLYQYYDHQSTGTFQYLVVGNIEKDGFSSFFKEYRRKWQNDSY